jgi:hypothetical protein
LALTATLAATLLHGQEAPRSAGALRILFAGDLAWGESYQDQLQPLLHTADVVVANLETPVATTRESPFVGQKDYIHYADPVQTPAGLLRHNIRIVGRPGVASIDPARLAAQVADIRKTDPHAFVVLFPHWGENYRWKTDAQTTTAHACLDAGVDLIIGHGAHMLQEIERYHDKWVVYSIGNFVFNASGRYAANKVDPFGLPALLEV